jgi:hypothetical protein
LASAERPTGTVSGRGDRRFDRRDPDHAPQ